MTPLDPAVAAGRNLVRRALADLGPGSRIVVAVSGGADSLALAQVAAFVAGQESWDLRAVVVDHQLQIGSADVAAQAAKQLHTIGIDTEVVTVEVGRDGGPEAAARTARRGVLETQEADAVLLAHTLDDQAETVLLGLGRGSGLRSIAGMAEVTGVFRRPFLRLRRSETQQICRATGLTWWDDPHNVDPAYRRVRVRTEVLPLLEDVLGGGAAEALARTANQARADSAHLDTIADAVEDPLDVGVLAALPAVIRSRVLRRTALAAGANPSELAAAHLAEIDRLVTDWHGQLRIELPGGVACVRVGDSLAYVTTPVGG